MARRVPLRRSLLVRLLATSVLVAIAAGAATTWLAVRGTSQDLRQQQSQSVAAVTDIYHELVGYAATHRTWADVGAQVRELARQTGRRIVVTTTDRRLIADSAPSAAALPSVASATIDPLQVDSAVSPDAAADPIDPRAVGPYQLDAATRARLAQEAGQVAKCMSRASYEVTVRDLPDGRPVVAPVDDSAKASGMLAKYCHYTVDLGGLSLTEKAALNQLNQFVAACLAARGQPPVNVQIDFTWIRDALGDDHAAQACVTAGRRQQLADYTAPPATLFIIDPAGAPAPSAGLSAAALTRIVAVAALVLAISVAVTVFAGLRLVRPLRALTDAVSQPTDRRVRAPVTTRDEIGQLATAFNDLSQRREHAEDQRKAMVSDIAHELRTPLTNIRGWLEAAVDGVASRASDPTLMSALLREAVLLQHVVDDLQDLAAADAGTLRMHLKPVSVAELLSQVATAHRAAADAVGVVLRTTVAGRPQTMADPARLRQAVGNLVANAIRHTPSGGSVELRAERTGEEVVIEIVDTGSGIAAEDLPKVFDRFWRAEKSRSRQTGGSGLGLAIVRQLVEAHGGSVAVTSDVGVGSVFVLRLPRKNLVL